LIAEKITKLIMPRQTIFMDTGSTTLICAEALARVKGLKVITNSTRIAATFASATGEAEVYLLGGGT
jgi:DeoR/GlpR family transcriptional regulator of sugar metabolism